MSERVRRLRDDRGQVAGIEAIPFGILVFVVGALLIANAWAVIDVKMAANAAARSASRVYVEASDHGSGRIAAEQSARETIRAHGRNPNLMAIEGPTDPNAFTRCRRVTFTIRYPVPAMTLPIVGGLGSGFIVTSSHSEIVDPFRNEVPGDATCA